MIHEYVISFECMSGNVLYRTCSGYKSPDAITNFEELLNVCRSILSLEFPHLYSKNLKYNIVLFHEFK